MYQLINICSIYILKVYIVAIIVCALTVSAIQFIFFHVGAAVPRSLALDAYACRVIECLTD